MRITLMSLLCFLLTATAWSAKVHLKDGTVISGKIESADQEKVEITTSLGVRMTIPKESIGNIEYEPGERQQERIREIKERIEYLDTKIKSATDWGVGLFVNTLFIGLPVYDPVSYTHLTLPTKA